MFSRGLMPVVLLFALLPQDPQDQAKMLQRAQQLARTYEPHQRLQALVGTWEVTVRSASPGAPERTDRGSVVGKAILGGRYVVLNFQLQLQGHAVEAVQILGFDNLRQRYTSSWRDDLSTGAVECSGAPDAATPLRLQLDGELADARDPEGRPFRLELELPAASGAAAVVKVRLSDTRAGALAVVQQQEWTRR